MSENLDKYQEARKKVPKSYAPDFDRYFIGAASVTADPKEWEAALETAISLVKICHTDY